MHHLAVRFWQDGVGHKASPVTQCGLTRLGCCGVDRRSDLCQASWIFAMVFRWEAEPVGPLCLVGWGQKLCGVLWGPQGSSTWHGVSQGRSCHGRTLGGADCGSEAKGHLLWEAAGPATLGDWVGPWPAKGAAVAPAWWGRVPSWCLGCVGGPA